jgi:hypothetical protein
MVEPTTCMERPGCSLSAGANSIGWRGYCMLRFFGRHFELRAVCGVVRSVECHWSGVTIGVQFTGGNQTND